MTVKFWTIFWVTVAKPMALLWLMGFTDGGAALRIMNIHVPHAALVGSNVILGCEVDVDHKSLYAIRWYKGGREFFRYLPKENPAIRTFPIAGIDVDVTQSDARQVALKHVSLASTGSYRCEVSGEAPSFITDTREATLNIYQPPVDSPHISVSASLVRIGDTLRANCTISKGRPPPELYWTLQGKSVESRYVVHYGHDTIIGLALPIMASFHSPYRHVQLRCTARILSIYEDWTETTLIMDSSPVPGGDATEKTGLAPASSLSPKASKATKWPSVAGAQKNHATGRTQPFRPSNKTRVLFLFLLHLFLQQTPHSLFGRKNKKVLAFYFVPLTTPSTTLSAVAILRVSAINR